MSIQLNLFENTDETLIREVLELKTQVNSVRKGIFARLDMVMRELDLMRGEIEELRKEVIGTHANV